jgi:regulator of sigma E protease
VRAGTPAAEAGLKPGDRVIRVGGDEVTGWNEVDIRLVRAGLQDSGIGWNAPPIVGPLTPGMPAERAGLRTGDRIESVDGQPVTDSEQVVDTIHGSLGRELTLTVRRGEEVLTFAVTPVKGVSGGKEVGLTGFMFQPPIELVKLAPVAAFRRGLALAREQAGVLFGVLRHLVIRDGKMVTIEVLREGVPLPLEVTLKPNVGFSSLSGPLDIAQASRTYASDLPSLLLWMGFISLQLGILNLLPIPVLDGGHILFLVTEGILRRDLSVQVKERLNQVGFIALVTLMAAVVCQDIWKRI